MDLYYLPAYAVFGAVAATVAIAYLGCANLVAWIARALYRRNRPGRVARPGEAVRSVLAATDDRLRRQATALLLFLTGSGLLAVLGERGWWVNLPLRLWAILALALLVLLGFALVRIWQLTAYRWRLQGLLAVHEDVAVRLSEAQMRGNRVHHAVPAGGTCIDTVVTRVTVFAVYTKAIPVIEQTFDLNIVRNLLDGLPLYAAFEPGPTKLTDGVGDALEYARRWEASSATLVVLSDGDSEDTRPIRFVPSSIADAIVIGVGNPNRPTMVAGHQSKQGVASLRSLASKLGGVYHQGNEKHLPSAVLSSLTMIKPRISDAVGLREVALTAVGVGAALSALLWPALWLFGRRAAHRRTVRAPQRALAGG